MYDTRIDGTQIDDTRIDGTQIDDTQIGGTRIDGTRIGGTQIDYTQVGGTQIDGAHMLLVLCLVVLGLTVWSSILNEGSERLTSQPPTDAPPHPHTPPHLPIG